MAETCVYTAIILNLLIYYLINSNINEICSDVHICNIYSVILRCTVLDSLDLSM